MEDQIAAIHRTFEDVKRIPKHPQYPSLKVQEVIPLFPTGDLAGNSYVQCLFDSDPAVEVLETKEVGKPHLSFLGRDLNVLPSLSLSLSLSLPPFLQLPKDELKKVQVDSAILKPIVNSRDADDNFVLYSQPNEDAVLKRKEQLETGLPGDEDDEYHYDCIREYTCTIVRNDDTRRNYFIVFTANKPAFYSECGSSLALHIRGAVPLFFLFDFSVQDR